MGTYKGETRGRHREIMGIGLLGFGLFGLVAVVSMQIGKEQIMGPGGVAAGLGLYAFAGIAVYLVIAASLVVSVRLCKGGRTLSSFSEVMGFLCLFLSVATLLFLPFSEGKTFLNGPGGLVGQYFGQLAASYIGGVGAALAAATLLCVAILLLTDIKTSEVLGVIAWAGGWVGHSIFVGFRVGAKTLLAGMKALGRITIAMFPTGERGEQSDEIEDGEEENDNAAAKEKSAINKMRIASMADEEGDEEGRLSEADAHALASLSPGYENDLPEEDGGLDYESDLSLESEDRRAVAAVVAEVAAVDCALIAKPEREALTVEKNSLSDVAILAPVTTTLDEGPTETTVVASRGDEHPMILAPIVKPAEIAKLEESPEEGPGFIRLSDGAFKLPPSDMLEYQPPKNTGTDEESLRAMADRLEQALGNYNVRGRVTAIQMGPVIITFEFAPAPGTRTGKIVQLENDLAMALEAQSVRIVAPIPGKAVVGIEIPNKQREMVYLKEILEEDGFRKAGAKLQIGLGKDTKGTPVSVNLAKMPHLLVAGTTGSGKSVAVNGMITSILYSATPEEVRFIMVDPKMLELSIYEGIPHLLLPVVTDPKKAALALRWAVDEMERRYELLAKSGVRDISTYNAKIDTMEKQGVTTLADVEPGEGNWLTVSMATEDGTDREVEVEVENTAGGGQATISEELDEAISAKAAAEQFAKQNAEPPPRKLPYIVIVIDEFADLMMVAAKDVDTAVARLAQKARAAGLHLILATQRPSVDVITGVIKANFPSRIALQVASQIDSRTILGQPGAETLLGNGDMLFSDRGTKLKRIQGAFLSDDEVHRVVEFLKKQAKPVYDMNIITAREDEDGEGESPRSEFHDELYDQALAIVCDTRQASVSYIQRRLQIGYNRAARMVEQLERDGIVGPSNGIRPRDVLAPRGEYLSQPPG